MIYINSTTAALSGDINLAELQKLLETEIFSENTKISPATMDEDSATYHRLCAVVTHTEAGKKQAHFTVSLSIEALMNGISTLVDSSNKVKYNSDKYSIYIFRKIHMRQYLFLFPLASKLLDVANDARTFMRSTTLSVLTTKAKKSKAEYYEARTVIEASLSHLTMEQKLDTLLTALAADIAGIGKIK